MTKIEKGVGYAKPDSLAITIPETECIHNSSAIKKTTYEIDGDGILYQERKNKTSQQFEKDGIQFTVQLIKPIRNEHDRNDYPALFRIPMPSKILGIEHYDEGWTLNNFEKGTAWIEKTTGIKFKNNAWAEARYSDLDNTVDKIMNAQNWSDELREIWQRISPETRTKYGRLFEEKNGLITGFTLNTRNREANRTVTYKYPFAKAYDKAKEIQDSRKQGNTWGMQYTPGDRKRYESQIRNGYWKENPILQKIERPQTFAELLTVYNDQNEIMTEYANRVLHEGYITLAARPKIQRDMKLESKTQFIIRELIELSEENKTLIEPRTMEQMIAIIKIKAKQAFKRQKAYEIGKELDEHWLIMKPEKDPNQGTLKI